MRGERGNRAGEGDTERERERESFREKTIKGFLLVKRADWFRATFFTFRRGKLTRY